MQLAFDLRWFLRSIVHLNMDCSLFLECSFQFSLATLVLLQVWEREVPERSVLLLCRTFQCPSSARCSASSTDICSDPQSTLPLPAIPLVSLANGNCVGLAQGWAQWQSWRQLERTEFCQILKGTNSQSTLRKKGIICGHDVLWFLSTSSA